MRPAASVATSGPAARNGGSTAVLMHRRKNSFVVGTGGQPAFQVNLTPVAMDPLGIPLFDPNTHALPQVYGTAWPCRFLAGHAWLNSMLWVSALQSHPHGCGLRHLAPGGPVQGESVALMSLLALQLCHAWPCCT